MGLFKPIPEEKREALRGRREALKEKQAQRKVAAQDNRETLKGEQAKNNSDKGIRVSFSNATSVDSLRIRGRTPRPTRFTPPKSWSDWVF